MTCLNDSHIQALADGEGDLAAAQHAAACARCGARLRDRREVMAAIERAIDVPAAIPSSLALSVKEIFRLKTQATGRPAGATHLLTRRSRGFRLEAQRAWIYSGIAVA